MATGEIRRALPVPPAASNTSVPEEYVRMIVSKLREAQDSDELRKHGEALTRHVESEQERARRRIADQMAYLRSERDAALSKRDSFESEVQRLKRQLEYTETEYKLVDKARVKTLQAQLQAALADRQAAQAHVEKLEDIVETLKLVNSLQRSMSKESEIEHEYKLRLQEMKATIEQHSQHIVMLSTQLDKVVQERNTVIIEKNAVIDLLHSERQETERLGRVVEQLRRRVHNAGNPSQY